MTINADAVQSLARFAWEHALLLVHHSTDYVFDGEHTEAYKETNKTYPINI